MEPAEKLGKEILAGLGGRRIGGGGRMKKRDMCIEDVIRLLGMACSAQGSQYQWATKHRLSPAYVSDVLNGRREPGEKMLSALGVERVVLYRLVGRGA